MVRSSLAPIAAAAAAVAAAVSIAQANPDGGPHPAFTQLVRGTVGTDVLHTRRGRNLVLAGTGSDTIHLDAGRGRVMCGPGHDVVYVSKRVRKHYRLRRCETVFP